MFYIATIVGVYSYIIFFIGISGLLYTNVVIPVSVIYGAILLMLFRKQVIYIVKNTANKKLPHTLFSYRKISKNKLVSLVMWLLILQAVINLIGALGPEHAFDALWYHLTLPKLYIQNHSIFFIPGSLLYYSAMPKLTEMLYTVALLLSNEIVVKTIHYFFGFACLTALYNLSRMFFDRRLSLLVVLIFSSNLVFAWESITAYVDLSRTFYEILALHAFIIWQKNEKIQWFILSAVMVGFAIAVKLIAVGSLLIFVLLIFYRQWKGRKTSSSYVLVPVYYALIALAIPLPWFIFSYIHTSNPIFPVLSGYPIDYSANMLNPLNFMRDIFTIFIRSDDPVSPLYAIALPLVIMKVRTFRAELKAIALYSFFAIVIWYITPRTGGGRFILPYLPAFSLLVGEMLTGNKINRFTNRIIVAAVIFVAFVTVFYRGYTNSRYLPVISGLESKQHFLSENLNFSFGDFYDTDNYFKKNIKSTDTVLLFGFHNLYYVDFPFIHSTWVKKGDKFNYIATQNTALPSRFRDWKLIHENDKTHVKVYTRSGKHVQY